MVKGTKGSTVRGVKDPSILTIKQRVIQVTAPTNSIRLLEEGGGAGWDPLGQSPAPFISPFAETMLSCPNEVVGINPSESSGSVSKPWQSKRSLKADTSYL